LFFFSSLADLYFPSFCLTSVWLEQGALKNLTCDLAITNCRVSVGDDLLRGDSLVLDSFSLVQKREGEKVHSHIPMAKHDVYCPA